MKVVARAFSLEAHAKLNLRLEVGLPVGSLHQIVSVIAALDLADELNFGQSDAGFQVMCDHADLRDRDNLVWRAAQALSNDVPDVRIVVNKKIPLQAGLGGGSADAGAALVGLSTILAENGVAVSHARRSLAALHAGSDVPGFLVSGLRVVSGVGDVVVQRADHVPSWGIVLLRPDIGSSTARAYALLDETGIPRELGVGALAAADAMCTAFATSDFARFLGLLHNDFTIPIERALPHVARARTRLEQAGAQGTILCGSGSCVAGFFESRAAAQAALEQIPIAAGEWSHLTGFSSA